MSPSKKPTETLDFFLGGLMEQVITAYLSNSDLVHLLQILHVFIHKQARHSTHGRTLLPDLKEFVHFKHLAMMKVSDQSELKFWKKCINNNAFLKRCQSLSEKNRKKIKLATQNL